ncbi:MAG TPA: hypothetical protein VH601_08715 [Bryobacteraceae bacterium]|jgi:hypothetical protein
MPNLLALSIFPAFLIASRANAVAEPVLVLIHNYANVDPNVLKRAEKSAAGVLSTAAVQVRWLDCPESAQAAHECQNSPDPSVLVLDLLPAGVTRRAAPHGSLGFAVPPEPGQFGSFAGVFCDRVERLSSHGYSEPVILGHAIAHEIGHLLLGPGGHSETGLMKPEWHRKELEQAVNGTLNFDAVERARIMQNLKARVLAHTSQLR